jgi:hypothetical protein
MVQIDRLVCSRFFQFSINPHPHPKRPTAYLHHAQKYRSSRSTPPTGKHTYDARTKPTNASNIATISHFKVFSIVIATCHQPTPSYRTAAPQNQRDDKAEGVGFVVDGEVFNHSYPSLVPTPSFQHNDPLQTTNRASRSIVCLVFAKHDCLAFRSRCR